jgi:prepilin-type processing-associated H-X9-DG protein
MNQNFDDVPQKSFPIIEVIAGIFLIVTLLALLLPALSRSSGGRRSSCQNNLKQWALVFKMYANESKGEIWPPLQQPLNLETPRLQLSPNIHSIYPEYLTDPAIAVCPNSPSMTVDDLKDSHGNYAANLPGYTERLDDCYTYWGWAFDKIGSGDLDEPLSTALAHYAGVRPGTVVPFQVNAAIQEAYTAYVENKPMTDLSDIKLGDKKSKDGNAESNAIYRLREGVERFLITDINDPKATSEAQSKLPIMHDLLYYQPKNGKVYSNHDPAGMNVLYFDGHVTYHRVETLPFSGAYGNSLAGALSN